MKLTRNMLPHQLHRSKYFQIEMSYTNFKDNFIDSKVIRILRLSLSVSLHQSFAMPIVKIYKFLELKPDNYWGFSFFALAFMLLFGVASAIPFNSFDPRSMAMGRTGVAVDDPSTAPFFNPAMLTASDVSKKYSVEFPIIGVRVFDPSDMRTNLKTVSSLNNSLTNSRNTLAANSTALGNSITTLSNSLLSLNTIDFATATAAAATVSAASTNIASVSLNMSLAGSNATNVAADINNINRLLLIMNNQPVQAEFGAATVIGIPGNDWGFAFYADGWGAMGGTLIYKDAETFSTLSTNTASIGTALTGSSAAITSTFNALITANNALNTAIASCTASKVLSLDPTCINALNSANANVIAANSNIKIVNDNVTKISQASDNINLSQNAALQSRIHIRGVFIEESGLSISHNLVISDQSWSFGITPKVMNLHLFDAKLSPDKGSITTGLTSGDNMAEYNAINFDLGVGKSYSSGLRIGAVVKNVIPERYEFKNALIPGGTTVPDGAILILNPQSRVGFSYVNDWSTVAFDLDVTRNNPAGLENYSQYVGIGGEWSAFGWAQLRAGYHHDLLNPLQPTASVGFGISPRIPYFKPHLDVALTASPSIFSNGWDGATQMGASLKAGLNF